MKIRDSKSLIIIFVYGMVNIGIISLSYQKLASDSTVQGTRKDLAPEFTEIEQLDYFHLKNGQPQLSLKANKMRSQADELVEFTKPIGVYNYQPQEPIHYQAIAGSYHKARELLVLQQQVELTSAKSRYQADQMNYYLKKDLLTAKGNIHFNGEDPRSQDTIKVTAESMRAHPGARQSTFKGQVKGSLLRKKKYEGSMQFASQQLHLDGDKSMAHLEGEVGLKREAYLITAQKADIHLENYNKSLKYFVLNDDVKVTETLETATGAIQRRAFAERLEAFGRDQKMVLSGAPRVEQGDDVIKGYRITIRENVDLIEVDDAMSDVQMKRQKKLKE
jgi:lipopolysaccharide export system protein LptA